MHTRASFSYFYFVFIILSLHDNKYYYTFPENEAFLESLEVTEDGEIVTPKKRASISTPLLRKKTISRKEKRYAEAAKSSTMLEENEALLSRKSIFDESSYDDSSTDSIHK